MREDHETICVCHRLFISALILFSIELLPAAIRQRTRTRKVVTTSKFPIAIREASDQLLRLAIEETKAQLAKLIIIESEGGRGWNAP